MSVDDILDENALVFEEMYQKVRAGASPFQVAKDHMALADKIDVGIIGLTYYLTEYIGRKRESLF